MLDVQTKAQINLEHRSIFIEEQVITLDGYELFRLPYRTFNIGDLFDLSQRSLINKETLEPLLSQILLTELYRDENVKRFLIENKIKIKKWQGIYF